MVDYKWAWGNSGSDGALLDFHYGEGYTPVLVYQNPLNYTPRINFTICKLYINFKNMKPDLDCFQAGCVNARDASSLVSLP